MIVDEIELTLQAGHGGMGKVSFGPGRTSGPDGGNGGRGGDIYIKTTSDLGALGRYLSRKTIKADSGVSGLNRKMYGKDAKDLFLEVPIGSTVFDLDTQEEFHLFSKDDQLLICKGGLGGKGNFEFRSSRNTTPTYAQPGLPGQLRRVKIILTFLAEYGLVGLPNTGKSSLLNALTNSKAVVGSYPFTTIEPNLGAFNGQIIADIPGLIEGASEGKGLGVKFLKHINMVNVIIHCISAESANPDRDYQVIINEIKAYNLDLLNRKQILLITKSDLVTDKELKLVINSLEKYQIPILPVSVHNPGSIAELKHYLVNSRTAS